MLEVIICTVLFIAFATCFIFAERSYRYDELGAAITLAVIAALLLIGFGIALVYTIGLAPSVQLSAVTAALIRISGLW